MNEYNQRRNDRLIVVGLWLLAGMLYSFQSYFYRQRLGLDVDLLDIVVYDATFYLFWGLLTPIVIRLVQRFPIERRNWLRHGLYHLGLGLLLATFHQTVYNLIFMPLRQTAANPFTWERLYLRVFGSVDYSLLIYLMIAFGYQGIAYYRRYLASQATAAQLQAELDSARLQALQMQLHPHFLFNTLNAISVLIRENSPNALKMLEQLSDLLRYTLQRGDQPLIPLAEELSFLERYLEIEKTRFGDRLTINQQVDPAALKIEVPTFLMQPIVENAVRHGVAGQRKGGEINIDIKIEKNLLHLVVHDNGPGFGDPENTIGGNGVGLLNTYTRLQTIYGGRARLVLGNQQGARVEVIIPVDDNEN